MTEQDENFIQQKWPGIVRSGNEFGFVAVPNALLTYQGQLRLTPSELSVLLQVLSFWWFRDRPPFPKTGVIAKRIGVSVRTVMRCLDSMEKKGLLTRYKGEAVEGGPLVRIIDLTGLIEKLEVYVEGAL